MRFLVMFVTAVCVLFLIKRWPKKKNFYSRCHFVSFVMYISGVKFEEHCSNMSGDILRLSVVLF